MCRLCPSPTSRAHDFQHLSTPGCSTLDGRLGEGFRTKALAHPLSGSTVIWDFGDVRQHNITCISQVYHISHVYHMYITYVDMYIVYCMYRKICAGLHCVNHMGMAGMIIHQPQPTREVQPWVDPAEKTVFYSVKALPLPCPWPAAHQSVSRPSNPVPPVTKKPGPVMPFHPIEPTHSFHSNSIIFLKFILQCTVSHCVSVFCWP